MKIREIFANNLKNRRKKEGFKSSRALAEEAGIAPITLAKIEASMGLPSEDTLAKIAETLKCEETDLFKDPNESIDTKKAVDLMSKALDLIKSIPPEYLEALSSVDWANPNLADHMEQFKHFRKRGNSKIPIVK